MKSTLAVIGLSAMALCSTAFAQEKKLTSYVEAGYASIKYDEGSYSLTPKLLTFKYGATVNQNFDGEVLLGLTMTKGKETLSGVDVELDVKNLFGAYVKPKLEVAPGVEVFGKLGFTRVSLEATAKGNNRTSTSSDSGLDISFGAGAQVNFNKDVYGLIDYMQYYNKDDVKLSGFTLGFGYRF